MNDAELDALLAAATPIDDADLAALPLSGPDTDLCEAIMSTPVLEAPDAPAPAGPHRRRFRPARLGLAAAAVVAAAFAAATTVVAPFGSDESPAWAAEAEAVADAVPRLLITADGWEIERAPQFLTEEVNLLYRNADGVQIMMSWNRDWPPVLPELPDGDTYETTVETFEQMVESGDLRWQVHRIDDVPVAGQPGVLFVTDRDPEPMFDSFSDNGDFTVQVLGFALTDDTETHALATGLGEDEFREVLASIESVDVDTWLAAMPHDVTH